MGVFGKVKEKKPKGYIIKKTDTKGFEEDVFVRVYKPENRKVAYTKYLGEAQIYATEDLAQGIIDDIMNIEDIGDSNLKIFSYSEVTQ